MQNKDDLRKSAKTLRKSLDMKKISEEILQIFCASDYYKNAKNIAMYYPYGTEVDLRKLFLDGSKNFYLPKTDNEGTVTFHKYAGERELVKGFGGILEPQGEEINPEILDLMILPCLMADKKGFRLGYGKGCYDRFLSKHKLVCNKIICIPESLLAEKLPTEEWDINADIIITEKNLIKC